MNSKIAAVGIWNDKSAAILSLPGLQCLAKEHFEMVPCSVLLCSLETISYLFCALGDGCLLIFLLNLETGHITDRKHVYLGSRPITLRTFSSNNTTHVFVVSDRPTVIYSRNKKLLYNNLDLKEVFHVCPFNTAAFPNSLVIADSDELTFGTVEYEMMLRIRSIPLEENAFCFCYQDFSRTFVLCSTKYGESNRERIGSSIHFLDYPDFLFRSSYPLEKLESGTTSVSCSFSNDSNVYYCIGTWYMHEEEEVAELEYVKRKGRILVLKVENAKLELVAEKKINDVVRSLTAFNGKLLAHMNTEIQLYNWMLDGDGTYWLQIECRFDLGSYSHILKTRGYSIVIGDKLRTVLTVLIYKPENGALEKIAACFLDNKIIDVEILDDDVYLGGDIFCNLFTLKRNRKESPYLAADCPAVGSYNLGICLSKFRQGSLVLQMPDSIAGQIPTCIFSTTDGAIGVVASLKPDLYDMLEKLQSKLKEV